MMSDETYEAMCNFADAAKAAMAKDEAALEQAEAALEQAEAAREHAAGEADRKDANDFVNNPDTWLAASGEKMIADGKVWQGALVRHPTGDHPQEIGQVCDLCAPEGYEGQVFVSWPWGSAWQYAARLEVLTPEAAVYELSRRVFMVCAAQTGWQLRPEIPHHPGDPRHAEAIKRQADTARAAQQINISGANLTPERINDAMNTLWPAGQVGRSLALTHGEATNNFADDLHADCRDERRRAFACYEKEVVRRVDLEADLDAARAAGHNMQGERDKALEELAQHKVWLEESQALYQRTSDALDAVGELATQMEQERDEARATLAEVAAARDELARDLAAAKSARTVAETDKASAVHEMRHALRKVEVMMGERDAAREVLGDVAATRDDLARDLEQARAALASKPASMFYHQIEAKLEDVKGDLCAALDERDEARKERDIAQRSLEAARAVGSQIEAECDTARADLHRAQLQSKALEAAIARHGEALAVEKARAQEARQDAEQTRKAGVQDREELEDCHKRMKAAEAAAKRAEADTAEQRQVLIDERNRATRDMAKLRIDVAKLTAALHGQPAAPDGDCEAKHS